MSSAFNYQYILRIPPPLLVLGRPLVLQIKASISSLASSSGSSFALNFAFRILMVVLVIFAAVTVAVDSLIVSSSPNLCELITVFSDYCSLELKSVLFFTNKSK